MIPQYFPLFLHFTENDEDPNGMKLTSELLLQQRLTQFLPGCDPPREALGAPLLEARLHPRGASGVHDQRHSWAASAGRAAPPQRLQTADPLHGAMLKW